MHFHPNIWLIIALVGLLECIFYMFHNNYFYFLVLYFKSVNITYSHDPKLLILNKCDPTQSHCARGFSINGAVSTNIFTLALAFLHD